MFASFFVDVAPMNSMMDSTPRCLHISSSILRLAAIALCAVATVAGQTRVFPSNSANSNNARRNHPATIHSADSSEGSRVSIASDQSLNDYEAYRRADRFYVKVPAAEVPRAEAVRGRGFADVTSQRNGSNTLLSFRLQPGASAHVEQHGNRLDVVISVPGGGSGTPSNRQGTFQWSDTSGSARPAASGANNRSSSSIEANANRHGNAAAADNRNSSARDSANNSNKSKVSNANSPSESNKPGDKKSAASNNSNSSTVSSADGNTNSSAGNNSGDPNGNSANSPNGSASNGVATAGTSPSPISSAMNAGSSSPGAQNSGLSNTVSPSPAATAGSRPDFWARAKERGHYWLLLAQLNPIPVAIGAGLLILIIALLLMQRRRARATRRVKTVTQSKSPVTETASSRSAEVAVPLAAAAVAATPAVANDADEITEHTRVAEVPVVATTDNGRKERVSRAAEEANKIFAGHPYDESVVGSEDRDTRRMVGAELLSAMFAPWGAVRS